MAVLFHISEAEFSTLLGAKLWGIISTGVWAVLTLVLGAGFIYFQVPRQVQSIWQNLASTETQKIYPAVIFPYQKWINWVLILGGIDIILLTIPHARWLDIWEFPIGLIIGFNISLLGFKICQNLFDRYLLDVALENKSQINSELLALAKFLSNTTIVLITVFLFAQLHHINLIGLIASLGIGGIAIAVASQKILEQILWSIVLYIDSPFVVGDYIHLSDSTLGKVESLGWRSTKVRLSGKNTLVVIPNSHLAQINIENLTRARREILIVDLTFFRAMADEEKALIRQLILGSTNDILGIDHQLTQVTFRDLADLDSSEQIQVQAVFFVLGAAAESMELRRNLLTIARGNIIERLKAYDITFKFEEKITDISQPMNL
jgi:MscS family membrane protein